MKTRQELILDFMLALAAGGQTTSMFAVTVYQEACRLADKYLENI